MITRVEGIIISSIDYKENDLLCHVLTKEYGMIAFVCKGAKKYTSKNRSSLLNYCLSEFIFDYEDFKTIFTLRKANYIRNIYKCEDLVILSAMNFISDILKVIINEDNDYEPIYDDYLNALDSINNDLIYESLSLYIAIASKRLGFKPIVDSCALCGDLKVTTISNRDGGFLCQKHMGHLEAIDPIRLKKFRLINHISYENIDYLKQFNYDIVDFEYMTEFFIVHIDMEPKSYRFLRSLLSN